MDPLTCGDVESNPGPVGEHPSAHTGQELGDGGVRTEGRAPTPLGRVLWRPMQTSGLPVDVRENVPAAHLWWCRRVYAATFMRLVRTARPRVDEDTVGWEGRTRRTYRHIDTLLYESEDLDDELTKTLQDLGPLLLEHPATVEAGDLQDLCLTTWATLLGLDEGTVNILWPALELLSEVSLAARGTGPDNSAPASHLQQPVPLGASRMLQPFSNLAPSDPPANHPNPSLKTLSTVITKKEALSKLGDMSDAQVQHALLRHCLDGCKLQWLLRTSPALLHGEELRSADDDLRNTLSRITEKHSRIPNGHKHVYP